MNNDEIQLPALCIRSLNDKIFEKKKPACIQIEIMIKGFNAAGQTNHIRKIINLLVHDFVENNNSPSSKIGGIFALSSVAVALEKDAKFYLDDIFKPILISACDNQKEVRYRAIEALYNIAKCVRGSILVYLNDIFDIIIRMCDDNDSKVREAASLVDKLMKDIIIENPSFNISNFINKIREQIYTLTQNTKKLILSWISFLDSVPDIDLLFFILKLLDGLFQIACDPNPNITRTAEVILEEFFLKMIKNSEQVEFKPLIKILLIYVQKDNNFVRNLSLKWLAQCTKLANSVDILHNSANIIAVILPCFSYSLTANDDHSKENNFIKNNLELAKLINESLMNLVTNFHYDELEMNDNKTKTNAIEFDNVTNNSTIEDNFNISKILLVLINELKLGSKASAKTKIAILEWFYQIYQNLDIDIYEKLDSDLLEVLLETLSDNSDDVVIMDLKVLCKKMFKVSRKDYESENYESLIKPLIKHFYSNSAILKKRGQLIICQLCEILDSRNLYTNISRLLSGYDPKFIRSMVYILNNILLVAKELTQLRNLLKNMINTDNEKLFDSSIHSDCLFNVLYRSWCYSPISAISLCLLTKCYHLASELILHLGNIYIDTDILVEIDQLIKMIESPIFISLRLDLLDCNNNYYLRKSLYGLLMFLPQKEAFHLLRKRLKCVPDLSWETKKLDTNEKLAQASKDFFYKDLLQLYVDVQNGLDNTTPNHSPISL